MIAVDAMGGDNAPSAIVYGALAAAKKGIPILLCGDYHILTSLLFQKDPQWQSLPITIEHCTQAIGMEEEPSRAVLRKKDASLVRAARAVADKRAQALVSAGNSGAVLAVSALLIGRVPGVIRPAVGSFIPTMKQPIFCLDLGANTDCKPEHLEQFAFMGHVYVSLVRACEAPRIALLSNGHEPYKGSQVLKEVYPRLHNSMLNFVGNIEGREIFEGHADVLVCDGFVGNVFLKTAQGTIKAFSSWIKAEANTWWKKVLLYCCTPIFRAIRSKTDYTTTGGALLLGVQAPVVFAHGSSNAYAVENAISFAYTVVIQERIVRFNQKLQEQLHEHGTLYRSKKSDERKVSLHAP